MTTPIGTVLIANRGEIAVRVIRTLRRLGITSVAVFSDADADAPHVRLADKAVRLGPAPARDSYLDIAKVIDAAQATGADAIHPGYGFLSENTAFAAACEEAGIAFLGPPAGAIEIMGDKITAKTTVEKFGVPTVPGIARPNLSDAELISAADEVGYPVLVKPSAGGGGKGMRLVHDPADLPEALRSARREASSSFGDETLFLERFVTRPRHIEVQVLADQHGNVIHLAERECSLQRRHQKVIEEAPSPLLDAETRARIGQAACDTARSVDYTGAGTVEFIVSADAPDEFFFMEMNTRLQVEHPVTEMVTGLDLVEWQVRVASGEPLAFTQDDVTITGHAVEARIYAEDPGHGFLPTGGAVLALSEPSGAGVRIDSGIERGSIVGSDYDPMLAKVIAHGADRSQALGRLDGALSHYHLLGLQTNVDFVRFLLADDDVVAGRLDTALLDDRAEHYTPPALDDDALIGVGVASMLTAHDRADGDPWTDARGWRIGRPVGFRTRWVDPAADSAIEVTVTGTPDRATVQIADTTVAIADCHFVDAEHTVVSLLVDNVRRTYTLSPTPTGWWCSSESGTWLVRAAGPESRGDDEADAGTAELRSPMPANVIAVPVEDGATVTAGTTIVVVEAMKMEHSITAPIDGVAAVMVKVGQQVAVEQVLARVSAGEEQE